MSIPSANMIKGSFTSEGEAKTLNLIFVPDKIELYNQTQMNSTANPGVVKKATWFSGMENGSAFVVKNTDGAATDESSLITSGGFTPFDSSEEPFVATVAVSSVSQASPAVVTTAAPHNLNTGDLVRLTNVTGMTQISGLDFTVTVTGATTFTIPLDTSGFATPGSAGAMRKLQPPLYVPELRVITSITAASPGVVTTATNHGFNSGDQVRIDIPSPSLGMNQLNGQVVTVTALSETTFSIGVNTSAYTPFAFPASGSSAFTVAQVVPIGDANSSLASATQNTGTKGITLGPALVGAASDLLFWIAYKADDTQSS